MAFLSHGALMNPDKGVLFKEKAGTGWPLEF